MVSPTIIYWQSPKNTSTLNLASSEIRCKSAPSPRNHTWLEIEWFSWWIIWCLFAVKFPATCAWLIFLPLNFHMRVQLAVLCWCLWLLCTGKMNQEGAQLFSGVIRHRDVDACAFGAVGIYLFQRFHLDGESFPTFTRNEEWYMILCSLRVKIEKNQLLV